MKYTPLLAALLLTSCGTLPEPFYGNPGPEGARLSIPPAPVLVVPTPTNAMLSDDAAKLYANDLATALAAADVPSVAKPADKTDWLLTTTATLSGTNITPHYTIIGPDGKSYGQQDGSPAAAADWSNGTPASLAQAANTDAIPLAKLLAAINAQVQQSSPDSLENRPPRVYFAGVTGAPGDGNSSLALNVTRDLPNLGILLVNNAAKADFILNGTVSSEPDKNNQILVEIDWFLHDANNREIGKIAQIHDLNPTDIIPYWGDVAAAAASEGANGIREAIQNATLHKAAGS